jgi:2-iminobutanoate/2-iminopropanoate deaminase
MPDYFEGVHNPRPAGPYTHAVRHAGLVVTAGQVGADPVTREPVGPDVASQTRQAIANLRSALEESGASLDTVLKVGVYLTRTEDFAAMNEVYSELIPAPYPARSTVFVGLMPGLLVEIDAWAYASEGSASS